MDEENRPKIEEVLPKSGLVYSERGGLSEVLCKPKLMPLKSVVIEQLEKIEAQIGEEEESKTS
jgi:BBSome-interacting protein 1